MKTRLDMIQGIEKTDIPEELLEMIRTELHRLKRRKLSHSLFAIFLKKHPKFRRFQNHAVKVIYRFNDEVPIQNTNEQVGNIMTVFDIIDKIYDEVKPPERTTFLSYFYVISKVCQMLGYPYTHIPLLKSKDQLLKLDRIWRAICSKKGGTKNGWKFRSSF